MSDHYYSSRPSAASERQKIDFTIDDTTLSFYTDSGVFSKNTIDFGSRLLIRTVEWPNGGSILDIGCGYGPIGLFAAKLNPSAQVTMVDVNERAVELARENAALNQISNVDIFISDGLESVSDETKFDCILTNPPIRAGKKVIYSIFEQSAEQLRENGALWIVIRKQQGADSAKKKMETLFDLVEIVEKSKGYYIIKCEVPIL